MKRSPLKRKTPLRSKGATLKRSRLSPVSSEKKEWRMKYAAAKNLGSAYVRCAQSGLLMHKSLCDPHHPFGQVGERIMAFLWISKSFHDHLHKFGKQSYDLGWLQPPFRGQPLDPNRPRPWGREHEDNWPSKYQRLDTQP